jgi:P27 family predicted phage terminase small subunit
MVRGRKPKPVALKLVEGNPGKRKLPKPADPPKRERGRPTGALIMPAGLTTLERHYWRSIIRHAPAGIFTRKDEHAIRLACAALATFEEASKMLAKSSLVVRVGKKSDDEYPTVRANPLVKIRRDAAVDAARFLSDLGFNPTAAARLGLADEGKRNVRPEDEDEERFFGAG